MQVVIVHQLCVPPVFISKNLSSDLDNDAVSQITDRCDLFCAIFTLDMQQTVNNQATLMKFRPSINKTINYDVIKVLLI
jgi:hypothetical protein